MSHRSAILTVERRHDDWRLLVFQHRAQDVEAAAHRIGQIIVRAARMFNALAASAVGNPLQRLQLTNERLGRRQMNKPLIERHQGLEKALPRP